MEKVKVRKDLTGLKFGKLTVIKQAEDYILPKGKHLANWFCICECGKEKNVLGNHLKTGKVNSCGCWQRIIAAKNAKKYNTKHGLSEHPLYLVWEQIKKRCYNKKGKNFEYYGKRGIKIYEKWKNDFKIFYVWCIENGWKKGLEIDRINNDGNYEPENCRFVTRRKNCLNRRLLRNTNTSGYEGINWKKKDKRWHARICIKGKRIYIGSFKNIEDAVKARNYYIITNNLQNDYKVQDIK